MPNPKKVKKKVSHKGSETELRKQRTKAQPETEPKQNVPGHARWKRQSKLSKTTCKTQSSKNKNKKKINTLMNLVQNQRNCNRTYREKATTKHQP